MRLTKSMMRTFLFWFSNEHSGFREAELESLFKIFKLDRTILESRTVKGPFVLMNFQNEDEPKKIMSRTFLVHSCYELWASGETLKDLHEEMKGNFALSQPYLNDSFQIRVDTYGKKIPQKEKVEKINTFEYMPLEGKVDLISPSLSLHLIQYYGLDSNNVPDEPYYNYFGRWVADGQRKMASKINLQERKFIGNTSMDPLLSLLMANLALVKPNDVVVDPFVGTGSLLVAASVLDAYVIGNDIDYLMIHAQTRPSRASNKTRDKDESVRANLKQYGVEDQYLDVVVADTSRSLWRNDFKFDAIITDPPYGIRESTERIGTDRHPPGFKIKEEYLKAHIPSKVSYTLQDIFTDLIDFSFRQLVVGGRLAFWLPVSRVDYDEKKLPQNPGLTLVANVEQCLTSSASRRLLVYEKVREFSDSCTTYMDGSALMYRFKIFDNEKTETRKSRKAKSKEQFGIGSKRGLETDVCKS